MTAVLKWTVPVDDRDHPIGAGPVVLVACQGGPEAVQVWTLEDQPQMPMAPRAVRVYGTGQTVPPDTWHLGSTMAGSLVWHLFGNRP